MWLMVASRPDIAWAVGQVAQFVTAFTSRHWVAVKRIMRYLKGTSNYSITYTKTLDGNLNVEGYSDADWAGDTDSRRSTSGYIFMVCGAPYSWNSKLQRVVAMSSSEAELIALTAATKEAIWVRKLLRDLDQDCKEPTLIHEDNQGAIAIATNSRGLSSRTKHVATRYLFVRHHIDDGEIIVEYLSTIDMLADICTKPCERLVFCRLVKAILSRLD